MDIYIDFFFFMICARKTKMMAFSEKIGDEQTCLFTSPYCHLYVTPTWRVVSIEKALGIEYVNAEHGVLPIPFKLVYI